MRKIQFVEDGCRVVVLGDALHPSYNSTGRATPRVIARELATNSIQKMSSKHRRTKFSRPSLLLLLSGLEILLSLISLSTKSPTAAPCASPEYHVFDFWLADCASFNIADSTQEDGVRIARILHARRTQGASQGVRVHQD